MYVYSLLSAGRNEIINEILIECVSARDLNVKIMSRSISCVQWFSVQLRADKREGCASRENTNVSDFAVQVPVVQMMDRAIQPDKYCQNVLCYPLFDQQGPGQLPMNS